MKNKPLEERFWEKVDKKSDDECWNWIGSKDRNGYGEFWFPERGKHTRSHQISWIIQFGEIPDNLCICHKCDNPSCVNPNHLFLGTMADNVKDRDKKGRRRSRFLYGTAHPQHGTNSKFHKLNEKDVIKIRELWKTGNYTLKGLANIFCVSPGLINNINHGRKWAWLK